MGGRAAAEIDRQRCPQNWTAKPMASDGREVSDLRVGALGTRLERHTVISMAAFLGAKRAGTFMASRNALAQRENPWKQLRLHSQLAREHCNSRDRDGLSPGGGTATEPTGTTTVMSGRRDTLQRGVCVGDNSRDRVDIPMFCRVRPILRSASDKHAVGIHPLRAGWSDSRLGHGKADG
jgi:hypothetical protein